MRYPILSLFIVCLCHVSDEYPEGAPSCSSRFLDTSWVTSDHKHICRPGHGAQRGSLSLSVVRIAQRRWRVSVPGGHRGLLLRAEGAGGLWWGHVPGYKEKGRWVTH